MLCALGSQPLGLLTPFFWLVLFQLKPLGCDGNSQPSVPAWLDSLGLQDYVQSFLSSGYSSIDTVKNLWELEIVNVSTALLPPAAGCCHVPAGLGLAGSCVKQGQRCPKLETAL